MQKAKDTAHVLADALRAILWTPETACFEVPCYPDQSRLLAELVRLPQPLYACYPADTAHRQYRIDLCGRTMRHQTKPIHSATFFIDADATDDGSVAIHGLTRSGNEWRVVIVRGSEKTADGKGSYLATITIGTTTFEDRVIRCASGIM